MTGCWHLSNTIAGAMVLIIIFLCLKLKVFKEQFPPSKAYHSGKVIDSQGNLPVRKSSTCLRGQSSKQAVGLRLASSILLEKSISNENPRLCPATLNWEFRGWHPAACVLRKPLGDSDAPIMAINQIKTMLRVPTLTPCSRPLTLPLARASLSRD